ncbi:MAG: hypothetical protein ACXACC_00105 [Promethearchaeota archaeon]|jgi:hypothetical protein
MPSGWRIQKLHKILTILEQFNEHPNSNFNFSKLEEVLDLLPKEGEELLDLIFQFQELFHSKLNGYVLYKKRKNTNLYLALKAKSQIKNGDNLEVNEINMTKAESNLLSDIIYYFQHIKIGKGFDVSHNNSELIQKVRSLKGIHPYFFGYRGNGLIYPSKLAVDLGVQILSYQRGNKPITELNINDDKIIINSGEKK